MTDEVRKWLRIADSDWKAAQLLLTADTHAAVCFHVQQCVEKLMKAALIARKTRPPYIHSLVDLSAMLSELEPAWSWSIVELRFLTRGAVEMRYVYEEAFAEDAREAIRIGELMRDRLLFLLLSSAAGEQEGREEE
jgi:HEPN domain-containing protein